jgi:hypothetical protein
VAKRRKAGKREAWVKMYVSLDILLALLLTCRSAINSRELSPSIRCLRTPPPFAKGLPPAEIIYRREVVEFFQPDLYHDSVAKGRFLYDRLTRSLVPPVVLIPAPAS